ncbi:receptor-type tyrosine-protein phosphatase gamma [Cylas formicarius]|uniref:receptor-type tyrosine-protein phosphatase gamma n=1 Tax=Cylas formicarius TaxID=197179 RepID=UPI002958AB5F|nr:receptor-type tyrosine-protein phosphatase gamma [Cylas formicarius]
MGVTLQLILGVLLTLSQCSTSKTLRPVREAPPTVPPQPSASPQNVTEINNRDLNKIVKDQPKTELTDPKNAVNRLHIPLELHQKTQDSTTTHKNDYVTRKKETEKREGSGRSIDVDSAKFWSPEFHNKNNFFTLSSSTDGDKLDARHNHPTTYSYDVHTELTTPTTTLFDQKYKETVESVDQHIDEFEPEEDDESEFVEENRIKDRRNGTLEFTKTKTIVSNETADKNSVHKNVNVEESSNVSFESIFNDTKVYDEVSESSTTLKVLPATTTTTITEKNNSHLLNNKIETDVKHEVNLHVSTTPIVTSSLPQGELATSTDMAKTKLSEPIESNQVIPLQLADNTNEKRSTTLSVQIAQPTTLAEKVPENSTESVDPTTTETVVSTTETTTEIGTTTSIETTTDVLVTDYSTPIDGLTSSTVAIITSTEELDDVSTTEIDIRTSKALKVTTTTELTTDAGVISTEATSEWPLTTTTSVDTELTTIPAVTSGNEQEFTFVHIKTVDSNHTTLVPDVLTADLNYSTPNVVSEPVEVRRANLSIPAPASDAPPTTEEEEETEPPTENPLINDEGKSKGTIAAIVISSVGAVCLILLAGLLYVMKKRQKRFNYGPRCTPVSLDEYSIDNLSVYNSVRRKGADRMSKRSFGNPAFDDPVVSHPLNFPALAKFASNFEDIKAEFEDIPQITARTSELPEGCDSKNRYANVIPLPETRVNLKFIDGYPNSDYINANYVTGPKNIRGYYIATQGPMQNTVDDFWRMVWEQQVKVVLMLTHLVENGLEKCVDYLPESEVVDNHRLFGDFQITLKKREVKDKYIISSLQLKNMVSNSWREVTHFWYLGWPEKGVPAEANSLIAFLIEARSYMKTATLDRKNDGNGNIANNDGAPNDHSPVVVHCSPGTGRTGVAMACDIAIREFETTRLVDIPKIVYRIRRDRANAIQTKEQYQFIYKVVSLYATKLTGGVFDNNF